MRGIRKWPWLIAALTMVALVGVACSNSGDNTQAPGAGGDNGERTTQEAGDGSLTLAASSVQFGMNRLEVPADEEVELTFQNNAGSDMPHNVAIYTNDSASEEIFVGDEITGGQETTYTIPATPAGDFYFRCDIHPSMEGTAVFA